MEKPNYFSILTAEVRYDPRLTPLQKLLFSEITALTNKTGQCWASNQYFADLYEVSDTWVSLSIKKLVKLGYIKSFVSKAEGNKRYLTLCNSSYIPIKQKLNSSLSTVKDPYLTTVKENNINNNNKENRETHEKEVLILETIKTKAGLLELPGTEAYQKRQSNLIRKKFEKVLGENCSPEELTEAVAKTCSRMKEDEMFKNKIGELSIFCHKIPLYSPLFKSKKEVYL